MKRLATKTSQWSERQKEIKVGLSFSNKVAII